MKKELEDGLGWIVQREKNKTQIARYCCGCIVGIVVISLIISIILATVAH